MSEPWEIIQHIIDRAEFCSPHGLDFGRKSISDFLRILEKLDLGPL